MKEKYEIWFELFGRKMKTTIAAISEGQAKSILMSKIVFHKIKVKGVPDINSSSSDEMLSKFKDLFSGTDNPFTD